MSTLLIILLCLLFGLIVFLIFRGDTESLKNVSLYERLGGVYAIAAVIDYFSDNLINNPIVGINSANPQLREWHRNALDRLPGLKFMRTLWVCDITGGPFTYHASKTCKDCPVKRLNLQNAHCKFQITSQEFDAVAEELRKAMEHFNVGKKEQQEVLEAFASHKHEIIACAAQS